MIVLCRHNKNLQKKKKKLQKQNKTKENKIKAAIFVIIKIKEIPKRKLQNSQLP